MQAVQLKMVESKNFRKFLEKELRDIFKQRISDNFQWKRSSLNFFEDQVKNIRHHPKREQALVDIILSEYKLILLTTSKLSSTNRKWVKVLGDKALLSFLESELEKGE